MVKAFDGSEREAMPSARDLFVGSYVEFFAMLLFVFFGCGSAASNVQKTQSGEWDSASVVAIALVFGLLITVLAYGTAHTSGGHINCAVTFALTLVGKCHPVRGACYLISQLLGSITGAALLLAMTNANRSALDRSGALGANGFQNPAVTAGSAFVGEVMGTALLVYTVLESAVNAKAVTTEGESAILGNKQNLAPIPIGLAVFCAHIVLIPITGCSINPTRSFGPSVVAGSWDNHWVWWVGPLTGALAASLVWLGLKFAAADRAIAASEATVKYTEGKEIGGSQA